MRDMRSTFSRLYMFLISLCMLLVSCNSFAAYETRLSDIHIQSMLVKHFPIREYAAFARVTLHEPQIILSRDSRDMHLVIPVDANITDQAQKQGHARVAVKVSYKSGNGGLYLDNPRMIKFEMPGISKEIRSKLIEKISTMCSNSLPLMQIFKVKESSLNHSLAKSKLTSFSVDNSHIKLVFGFD